MAVAASACAGPSSEPSQSKQMDQPSFVPTSFKPTLDMKSAPDMTSTQTPQEPRIVLSLPYSEIDEPVDLMPMGETISHPDPPNPGGHPGLDFIWDHPAPITACADGIVVGIERNGIHPAWDVGVKTGRYLVSYTEMGTVNDSLQEGTAIKAGTTLGYPQPGGGDGNYMIHWNFGYYGDDPIYPMRLNPMTYFDNGSRARIEALWARAPYSHKDRFPEIANGIYVTRNE